ncbi:MAG: Ku protein [Pseudomonadales bacterium]
MAARAMWKGVIRLEDVRVPVKLYAAVEDRSVHFRLLHAKDHAPVKQALVDPHTDEVVPYAEARRAYVTEDKDLVILDDAELAGLEPAPSRDIHIHQFVPPQAVDHRWYRRPYYLGPDDGAQEAFAALTQALADLDREGLASWVMRKKAYLGALRLHAGYPILVALRYAEEIVAVEDLPAPQGRPPDQRELAMARQLIDMLAADFEPAEYHDEYRARVEALIAAKAKGDVVAITPPRKPRPAEDLTRALEASLKQERKRA